MSAILIVDDNIDSCKALARLLTHMGDRAICVDSGQLAIAYLRTHLPQLIILDVMMPDMDGIQVLQTIRSDPRTAAVPVVMFSASSEQQYVEAARSKGANDYWVKSQVDFSNLKKMVSQYVA